MSYLDTLNKRRSVYALNDELPLSHDELVKLVEDVTVASPSAFNVQSSRAVVLTGEAHKRLWNGIVRDALHKVTPADAFANTEKKLAGFAAAAGTVLFFDDQDEVDDLKRRFPTYADAFDRFAQNAQGILQGNLWNALAEAGVGANLQHYNPLIDDAVKAEWDLPASWLLSAQLVFGGVVSPAGAIEKRPASERVRVFA